MGGQVVGVEEGRVRGVRGRGRVMVEVIAEIGSNHCGDIGKALELIDVAGESGADTAKFQYFRGGGSWRDEAIRKSWCENEMPGEWLPELAARCEEHDMEFLCSIFDPRHIPVLEPYVERWKVASIAARDRTLVMALGRTKKPIIISMGYLPILEMHSLFNAYHSISYPMTWLYCVAQYPCKESKLHMANIRMLKRALPRWKPDVFGYKYGFSDHTLSTITGVAAVAMGAVIIEKHIKLEDQASGVDSAHALGPEEFKRYVENIRAAERFVGYVEWPQHLEKELERQAGAYIPTLERLIAENKELSSHE